MSDWADFVVNRLDNIKRSGPDTVASLRAENARLKARVAELEKALGDAAEQMEWLAENDPHCMGWVGPPWPSTTPAIKVAAQKARAALNPSQEKAA